MSYIPLESIIVAKNYIKNGQTDNGATTGYATYADAAGTSPVDGTGGSPNTTFGSTSTNPIRGPYSFLITKNSGASRQGEGVSYDFTIDNADIAKTLTLSFDYDIGGTYTDGDISVWLYDKDAGVLIQPAPSSLPNAATGTYPTFKADFQTNATSKNYRLIWHISGTSNASATIKLDNIVLGTSRKISGAPITDWQTWTPTGSWTSNTTYSGMWRRVGDSLQAHVYMSLSGAPTSATLTVNLPTGMTIDTSKLESTTQDGNYFGRGGVILTGGGNGYGIDVRYNSTTSVVAVNPSGAGGLLAYVTQVNPGTFGNGGIVGFSFTVPILGWSSSLQLTDVTKAYPTIQTFTTANSSGTYTTPIGVKWLRIRMVGCGGGGAGAGSGAGNGGTGGNTTFGTSLLTANGGGGSVYGSGSGSPAGGTVTVNSPAITIIAQQGARGGNACTGGITNGGGGGGYGGGTPFGGGGAGGDPYVYNGTAGIAYGSGGGGGNARATGYAPGDGGAAGGYIEAIILAPAPSYAWSIGVVGSAGGAGTSGGAGAAGAGGAIIVEEYYRSEGTIAADETVSACYTTNTGSLSSGSDTLVQFNTKDWDTHGAVTTGASWKFTAPVSGLYSVSSLVSVGTAADVSYLILYLYKNGARYRTLVFSRTSGTNDQGVTGTTSVKLLAGEYIDIRGYTGGYSPSLSADNAFNWVVVTRTGNY